MGVFVPFSDGRKVGWVIQETGCWDWLGETNDGYGRVWLNGRLSTAHRVVYERIKGPIPAGLQLDHLCRNRCCVNPAHLEAVTKRENILRGVAPSARQARQTHCKRGHLLGGENLILERDDSRRCRSCKVIGDRQRPTTRAGRRLWYAALKERRLAAREAP